MPAPSRRAVVITAPCGVGKTQMVLERLAVVAPGATLTMLFPTVALMREVADRFETLRGHRPVILLGIDHADCPEPRRREIRDLMARHLPYGRRVCATCPKRAACQFHAARRAAQRAPVVFATVQLATQHPSFFDRYARDVVVFEEDSYDQLVQRFEIREADISRIRRMVAALAEPAASKFGRLVDRLSSAFTERRDLPWQHLWRGIRWTQADAKAYRAACGRTKQNALSVLPWLRNARRYRTDLRLRRGQLVGWRRIELPRTPLYVVLDATANPRIVAATLGADVVVAGVRGTVTRTTKVVQTVSHSWSKDALGSAQQRLHLVEDVRLYIEDCRTHHRRPALVVRPSMAGSGPVESSLNDDFRLLAALEGLGYGFRVLNGTESPGDVGADEIPVITYRRERGINLLLALGCTDVMILGVLRPAPLDVIDRARILFGLRESDEDLTRFQPKLPRSARTRLGRQVSWTSAAYVHPEVELVYRHMVVAPVVQAAERIRSLLDLADPTMEKRIFLDLQEDVSDWLQPDFIGSRKVRNAQWFDSRDDRPTTSESLTSPANSQPSRPPMTS